MSKLTHFLLAALIALPSFACAADETPKPGDGQNAGDDRDRSRDDRRERFYQRLKEENPDLKDVDFSSPEGQAKLREVMQARMEKEAPRIRERIAERKAEEYSELAKEFKLTDEEFKAIQPLITRVDNLRSQRGMVDNAGITSAFGGRGRSSRGGSSWFNPSMLLGDTEMDPTVKEIDEALKALRTLIKDAQASDTEVTSALARVRKAREEFETILKNARSELRSVLTPQQEALLVDRGTLE